MCGIYEPANKFDLKSNQAKLPMKLKKYMFGVKLIKVDVIKISSYQLQAPFDEELMRPYFIELTKLLKYNLFVSNLRARVFDNLVT